MTCITVPEGDYIAVPGMHQEQWLPLPTTKENFLMWVKENALSDSSQLVCNVVRTYKVK